MRRPSYFQAISPFLLVVLEAGCAGNKPDPAASDTAAAQAKNADADAGADAATDEPPFAGSNAEATTLISAAVDKKGQQIGECVREFRARKKLTDRVSVSFGIDQEGKLLGVTSKNKEDAELKSCVQKALEGARFPRSHAGVITVTKTYGELVQ